MEIIYPRNTRDDAEVIGAIAAGGGIVDNSVLNQTFYDYLTQYFSEDNSKTIMDTINNYYEQMPDVGFNELIVTFMTKFEQELKTLNESIKNMDLGDKFIENHTVIDKGAFTWNDYTTNIYMLEGGVPSSITINQYITNICAVAIFGAEFTSLDLATGVIDVSLYPVEYLETLLANNAIIKIGVDNYVPLTICEITINVNELGDQLDPPIVIVDPIGGGMRDNILGLVYNETSMEDVNLSSSVDWRVPTKAELINVFPLASDIIKYKLVGKDYWTGAANNGELNVHGVSLVGNGFVDEPDGAFSALLGSATMWCTDGFAFVSGNTANYSMATFNITKRGYGIRFIKDAVGVADGETIQYVGNNGIVYNAVAINEVYIMTSNLKETELRDSTPLVEVNDAVTWITNGGKYVTGSNYTNIFDVINGAMVVLDNGDLSLIENNSITGMLPAVKTNELTTPKLASLLLRKI